MSVFDRFEKRIEGAVNGVFARAFKGDVQPVEIAARLQKELDSKAQILSRHRRLVPNEFVIELSQHDYDRLTPYGKKLTAEIIPELRGHAGNMGYEFNGPIMLHFDLDEDLPTGRFNVSSEAVAEVDGNAGVAAEPVTTGSLRRTRLVLEVNGMRHPLNPPGFTIGRGSDADLRINDPGISRRHARVQVGGSGLDLTYTITDLGSTNGISVNGERVRSAELRDGTRIEIGNTRMLVHAPSGQ
ncbi:FhaA domain-containing protein [Naumannella huperziae]